MSVSAKAIRKMVAMGLDAAQIADLCEALEEGFAKPVDLSPADLLTARQAQNARAYAKRQALKNAESALKPAEKTLNSAPAENAENLLKPAEIQRFSAPLARGEDNLLKLVDTGLAVVVDEACADDWPAGDASEHARLLCAEAKSHRLDPNRTAGLVTTRGRIAAWRRDGASWRFDVLPTVTEMVRKQGPPINVWTYFDRAIGQSIANNRRALEIPAHGTARPPASAKFNARQANMERALAGAESAAGGRAHATG